MSRYDGSNMEYVASRCPDGLWACCLCNGWKNRAPDNKDYKYSDEEIFLHMREFHFVKTKTLQASCFTQSVAFEQHIGSPLEEAVSVLSALMEAEGGEPGHTYNQKQAWAKADSFINTQIVLKAQKGRRKTPR